jgi:hypothetical protein
MTSLGFQVGGSRLPDRNSVRQRGHESYDQRLGQPLEVDGNVLHGNDLIGDLPPEETVAFRSTSAEQKTVLTPI